MTHSAKPSREIFDASTKRICHTAAEWLARREAGFTPEEQEQFSSWLLADARHSESVREIESAWRLMRRPHITGQADDVIRRVEQHVRSNRRARRRRTWRLALGGLAAAAAIVFGLQTPILREVLMPFEPATTVALRPERQVLPDGSVIELNAGTEIAVDFLPEHRAVRLVSGEAHFTVAKDPARPFVVSAGAVSVRAIGTEFAVRFDATAVDVLVTEGRVAVQRLDAAPAARPGVVEPAPAVLEAGMKTIVPIAAPITFSLEIRPVAAAEIRSALAWRTMRVEFTATRLADVLARFNQHNGMQLALADRSLADLRISGIFWLDDPEGFSRLIEESAGLSAIRAAPGQIVLARP